MVFPALMLATLDREQRARMGHQAMALPEQAMAATVAAHRLAVATVGATAVMAAAARAEPAAGETAAALVGPVVVATAVRLGLAPVPAPSAAASFVRR